MKNELSNIKRELEKRKNVIGLVGTRLKVDEVSGNALSAHITTDWKEINISYGKDLNLIPDAETLQFAQKKVLKTQN